MNQTRTFWRIPVLVFILLFIALSGLPGSVGRADAATVTATTFTPSRLRSGPGLQYDVVAAVPAQATMPVLGRTWDSSWLYVDYNGTRGWINAGVCWIKGDLTDVPVIDGSGGGGGSPASPTPPPPDGGDDSPPPPSGDVTAIPKNTLNLRAGPGTGYAVIGKADGGVPVPVLGRTADSAWIYVDASGKKGWIAAWLCDIKGDLNSVPVTGGGSGGGGGGGSPPPPPAGKFALGGQTHTLAHPSQMAYAGMTWVKFQHKWVPGQDPAILADRINAGHASGFKVLISIPGLAYPSSIDFNSYTEFVRGVALLGADGIEVWNEMNLSREWPAGQISPASYVNNMLRPAYYAIKGANPSTVVIAGALAPTGVHDGTNVWADNIYLAGMRDAGAAAYMDCVGVHHNAGATSPDAETGHPADGGDHHYSWYFWPTYNLYAGTFPTKDVCYTELGYLTGEGYGPLPPNFWWGSGTTLSEHAAWLARAAELLRGTNRVRLMIVYNVDFTEWTDDPQAGYAIIRPGGNCPACDTLHNVMK